MSSSRWFALESNPEVMGAYAQRMGLDNSVVSFHDVLGVEDWALDMVPKPVYAVLLLFPIKQNTETFRHEENARILADGQEVSPNVYYMQQTVGNACGTVGILHAIGNARHQLKLTSNSYLEKFYGRTCRMSPSDIAEYLSTDEEIEATHEAAAMAGQSAPDATDIDTHFICFR